MKRFWPLALLLLAVLVAPAAAQVTPDKAEATFTTSPGLETKLWASEPECINPTCMDVDHKGRVWVCDSVNYRSKLHNWKFRRPEGDRIVILEDTKGTGKADTATVFYQSPEILAPLGIAVAKDPTGPGYKVFVCQSPDILVFEDKEGKGKADGPPKKLLSGFNGIDHDHGVHGILIGPDNKLYFSVGDPGVNNLQSSDGKGRKFSSNNTDCRMGTIWRCNLDGTNLELIAHGFRNEYEPCVDSFGTVFVSDNDDDGNQQTRICYVMPGGDYGYHYPKASAKTHWHEEDPGIVPKVLRTFFGAPTGMCVYEGTLLPEKYRGQLLHTDAGPRHVRCYHIKDEYSSYTLDQENMVTSTDSWFRPSDICVGPDGSVYVADWYDPGVGGHGIGDWTRGRVYRIAPTGNKPSVPKVDLESKEGVLAALNSPALSVRYMAMAQLKEMPEEARVSLLEGAATQKDNPTLRARALWQLGRFNRLRLVTQAFRDPDPRFRILAMRILKDYQNQPPSDYSDEWKELLVKDSSPAVRREALLLLRDVDPAKARSLIYALAKQYDGKDRFYLEAAGIAVGHYDKARRDVILADFDKELPEWNDAVAGLVWEWRPAGVLPGLVKHLGQSKLTLAQRLQLVDVLAGGEEASLGASLLQSLSFDLPLELRDKIVEALKQPLAGKWKQLRDSKEAAAALEHLLNQADSRLAALALIEATEKADAFAKVAELARDEKEKPAIRSAAVKTLASLATPEAVAALVGLVKDKAVQGDALQALGKQSAGRDPKQPSVVAAMKGLETLVADKEMAAGVRTGAAVALAGSHDGGAWLLEAEGRKELPDEARSEVARLLHNSPFKDLRDKSIAVFPPAGKIDPKKIPAIDALVKRTGDANKGKQLLAASVKSDLQCLRCHTVRGVGGNVGPDLSMIGKKAGRDNLFESILYPSKAIADQYVTWVFTTKKGQAISGLLAEETPTHVILRDANGKDTKLDKADIDERSKDPKSMMPENLMSYMTEQDLLDIVAYLFTLKTSAISMDYWHIAGAFDNGAEDAGLEKVFPPEKSVDLKESYPGGKSGAVKWRVVNAEPGTGYVDLRKFLAGDSDNAVSYVYREVESPADQEATFLLGTDDCAKLWINGELVYTNRAHRAAVPEEDTVKTKLKKGKNTLLMKITNGDGDHGFYLLLLAEQELKRMETK
jgi:putative membrane-bound dehydrogenase-like protein